MLRPRQLKPAATLHTHARMGTQSVVVVLVLMLSSFTSAAQLPANTPCGVISWWPFDGSAADLQNRHSGVAQGAGGTFPPGIVANGWKSGGQGSAIVVADAPALDLTMFTIDVWVRLDTINELNMPIVWKGNQKGADLSSSYALAVYGTKATGNAGKVFAAITTNGGKSHWIQSKSAIPVGQPTHIVFSFDGIRLALYINGRLDPDPVVPLLQHVILIDSAFPLQIGGMVSASANNYFNGVIDELTIYDRALDATPRSEIAAITSAGAAGKCRQ